MKSPVISASSPCERMRTLTWPGVWPMRRHEADLVADPVIGLDQIDEPGIVDRRYRDRRRSRPCRRARAGCANARTRPGPSGSAPAERSGPIGRRPASCSSRRDRRADACTAPCRSSRADSRRRRDPRGTRPCRLFQVGIRRFSLSLPRQVSTTMRRPSGVSTTSAWMLILSRPRSSAKSRLQPADRQDRLIGRLRQDEPAAAGDLELDDLGDGDLADPAISASPRLSPVRQSLAGPPRPTPELCF